MLSLSAKTPQTQMTNTFIVEGGHPLSGSITPKGAKNEALQVLCACLLTDETVTISNVPDILDVQRLIQLLRGLGVKVERSAHDTYTLQAERLDLNFFHSPEFQQHGSKIRGSVMLMGPLLARFGQVQIPKPGGDKIGRRRLDTHFTGLKQLGGKIEYDKENNRYYIRADKLKGNYVLMEEISVTGTANVLMAAVLAEGQTTIYNAACEPYVQQLARLLNRMGARISGIGSNLLHIEGVSSLHGAEHRIQPDFIEVGSFIGLAATTGSKIRITGIEDMDFGTMPLIFERMGVPFQKEQGDLLVDATEVCEIQSFMDGSIPTIYDAPWPGFSPDLLSIILVMATQARGSLLVHQKMFESRLFFVDKLIDMGAKIILCDPHRATVIGLERKTPLRAIEMSSPDIRAGVALLIAALSAKGTSTIKNIHQIDRGYEDIDGRLRQLGAAIKRV